MDGLSLWSEGSFLSVASVGSFLSVGSVGSAVSLGSVLSAAARASVLSAGRNRSVLGEVDPRLPAAALTGALLAIAAGLIVTRARASRP